MSAPFSWSVGAAFAAAPPRGAAPSRRVALRAYAGTPALVRERRLSRGLRVRPLRAPPPLLRQGVRRALHERAGGRPESSRAEASQPSSSTERDARRKTGKPARSKFRSFEEGRDYVRARGFTSRREWTAWCQAGRRPAYIPANPNFAYRDEGWLSWADWLGTEEGAGLRSDFRPFEEARELVRVQGFESKPEWLDWCRAGNRPSDVPSDPDRTYRDEGWLSWPDWLGYGPGEGPRTEFLPYPEARALMHTHKLASKAEWHDWCRKGQRPWNLPSNPDRIYRGEGWLSWPDWLGYGAGKAPVRKPRKRFRPFGEARALVREQGLLSQQQWLAWCRAGNRPPDVPSNPQRAYASEGWLSWADWMGYGDGHGPYNEFLAFEDARRLVQAQQLKSLEEWQAWCKEGKRPPNVPSNPHKTYSHTGWHSWPDWLGYEERRGGRREGFLPFEVARAIARRQGLSSQRHWQQWCKAGHRPAELPSNPHKTYQGKGWVSWADWIGYATWGDETAGPQRPCRFVSYEQARAFVRIQFLENHNQWVQWCKDGNRPPQVPSNPERSYRDRGWVSWADFLGCEEPRIITFVSFEEARTFARALGLGSYTDWVDWCSSGARPDYIPSNPDKTYRNCGWEDWVDFLG